MLGIQPLERPTPVVEAAPPYQPGNTRASLGWTRVRQIVWEKRYPIGAIIAAAILLGLIQTLVQARYYSAETRLEFQPEQTSVQTADIDTNNPANTLQLNDQYFETQYELLKAQSLASDVVQGENLLRNPDFYRAFGIEGKKLTEKQASKILLDALTVDPVPQSNLVDIRFTTRSPAFSAHLANVWAQAFIAADIERRYGASIQARDFLESRLAQTRKKLEDAEQNLIGYASSHRVLNLPSTSPDETGDKQTLVSSQLVALNQSLAQARAASIAAASQLAAARDTGGGNQSTSLAALRARQADLAGQVEGLKANFGPDYPPLKAAEQQLKQVTAAMAGDQSAYIAGLRQQYDAARATEQRLQGEVNSLTQSLLAERRTGVQYGFLAREVDTNRQLYEALLQRIKQIGVEPTEQSNIVVVDQAGTPTEPSYPNPLLNLIAATLLGLMAAGAYIVAAFSFDHIVRSPAELEGISGKPVIGIIPKVPQPEDLSRLLDGKTAIHDAFLSARLALSYLLANGERRSVALTSTRESEGKSFTSIGLASAFQASGQSVLLVDADIRRGHLNEWLGIERTGGFSQYLAGTPIERAGIRTDPTLGFDVLIAGPYPPNPAELITSARLQAFHQWALSKYDLVLFDCPPVLGLADAVNIARTTDLVLHIVEEGRIRGRAIVAAENRLRQVGRSISAFVMTKARTRNDEYGYDYYSYDHGENT
jgi:capsular exopolysaccharide synthesis family protein